MYQLAIGDRTYSSWSLRGWLMFEKFDLPVQTCTGRLYSPDFDQLLQRFRARPHRSGAASARRAGHRRHDGHRRNPGRTPPRRRPLACGPGRPRHRPLAVCRDAFRLWRAARRLRDEPGQKLCRQRPACRSAGRSGADRGDLGACKGGLRRGRPLAVRALHGGGCVLCPRRRPDRGLQPARWCAMPRPMSRRIWPTRRSAAGGRWAGPSISSRSATASPTPNAPGPAPRRSRQPRPKARP